MEITIFKKLSGLVKVIHLVIAVSTNSYSISTGPRSSIKISEIAANFTINGDMGLNSSKYFVYSGSNSMSFRNWRDSDKLMIFPGSVSSGSKLDPYFSEADIAILHYIGIYDTVSLMLLITLLESYDHNLLITNSQCRSLKEHQR